MIYSVRRFTCSLLTDLMLSCISCVPSLMFSIQTLSVDLRNTFKTDSRERLSHLLVMDHRYHLQCSHLSEFVNKLDFVISALCCFFVARTSPHPLPFCMSLTPTLTYLQSIWVDFMKMNHWSFSPDSSIILLLEITWPI